jgi:hypothetical protein
VHGYKAHVATDEASVLPAEPGDVYGDSAFGSRAAATIAARGGRARNRADRHLGRHLQADTPKAISCGRGD